ncbi:MAG TPA: glycosyltransferase family 4 protein [Thermoplasmata archaeon]|nr:glycosyltransferase family 4 protein [Thermoplasmata archaeon]
MTARPGPVTVIVPLPPTYRGGTEEYAYQLIRGYATHREVHVLATNVRYAPSMGAIDIGAAHLELLEAREVMQRPLLLGRRPRSRLKEEIGSAAVVQLHMPFPMVEAPAVRWARRAGVPTVLTYHMDADLGGASSVPGARAVTPAYRRLSAFPALANCDVVVSNSHGYAEASPVLSRYLSKMRVIPKGADPERLGLGGPSTRDRPPSVPADVVGKTVVFVGRLVPYKGVTVLLEAAELLRREGVEFTVLVAGRGPLLESLRAEAISRGLGSTVRFLGFVPDAEIGALYRFADVVCCPSIGTLESSATTLEEAAMCGTPVAGSDLPGASESIPHDGVRGILVPPKDANALAHALRRLLGDPRPEGPAKVRTWADVTLDYERLFAELGAGTP